VSDHPPSSAPDPLLGQQVGEYQVIEPVGEGGMGVVYLGIQPVIKKRVAIKVLKPQVAGDEHQVRRLVAEAESVNAIGHRGIIDIFGLGTLPDGRPYIVMEYLDGEALDVWLQKQPGGRVPLTEAVELLLEMCAPLAAAHRAGVIHRDLKPSNVFICRQADGSRYLKLLDFGLAKRAMGLDGNTKQTNQSVVAGTPDYMAPEQARGLDISPRSDIYAMGVIAFELCTGRVPFSGATPMDVMVAHVGTPPPDPRKLEPSLPESLVELILDMLAKAPDARPPTVDAVRAALEDVMQQDLGASPPRNSRADLKALRPSREVPRASTDPNALPLTSEAAAPRPATPAEAPVVVKSGPSRMVLGAAAVALLAAGAVVTWLVVGTRPPPPPVEPPAVVTPPVVEQPPPVLDAGVAATVAVVDPPDALADAGLDDEPGEPLPADAGAAVAKVKRPVAAPTTRQLQERLKRLEARAKAKKNLDPTALRFLAKYRIEATAAETAADRLKLDRALSDWERTFLKR
jgi:serine/threonine-protein kinase